MISLPKPMSSAEIARLVGGRLIGDEGAMIEHLSDVANAGPTDAASFHNAKYGEAAAASRAGCLFVTAPAAETPSAAKSRVVVEDPQAAFASLLNLIAQARRAETPAGVSPRASVSASAKVGANVRVGDFSVVEAGAVIADGATIMAQVYVGRNARVGRDCILYPQVVLREDCSLGDRVIVNAGAVIGADGFGFTTSRKTGVHTKIPQIGNVVVGNDVEIGANVAIDRATMGSTIIESGTKIDNLVQIAHNVKIGVDCLIVSQTGIAGTTEIGRNVVTAGQVGVAGHLHIGDGTVLTAQTGVMSDVPPKSILFGSPGRPHREAFKLQALYGRLPELFARIKSLEVKLGL